MVLTWWMTSWGGWVSIHGGEAKPKASLLTKPPVRAVLLLRALTNVEKLARNLSSVNQKKGKVTLRQKHLWKKSEHEFPCHVKGVEALSQLASLVQSLKKSPFSSLI